jgi:hypothetical protein
VTPCRLVDRYQRFGETYYNDRLFGSVNLEAEASVEADKVPHKDDSMAVDRVNKDTKPFVLI